MTPSERAELIAKITAEPGERDALAKKFAQFDAWIADIQRRLKVLEKQRSPEAVQPKPPELASWSPERLVAVLSKLSPDELEKLKQ